MFKNSFIRPLFSIQG